jgi:hypothetical protein
MKLTRAHRELLADIGSMRDGLSRSYFDCFPYKMRMAKDLLWIGALRWKGGKIVIIKARLAELESAGAAK